MREEKQLLLDDLSDKINSSKGFIVTQYQDFTASRSNELRNHLAEVGAEFEVVRKRVFIKAAEVSGITFDPTLFTGHIGVIFAHDDTTATVKGAVKYGENNNDTLVPIVGQIDGAVCSQKELKALATLPSLDELRAQFVGLLQAPMAHTVGVMQAVMVAPLRCMDEKAKKD